MCVCVCVCVCVRSATCGVVALALMWGSHSVSQSMVKTKLKSRIRKHAKRTAAAATAVAVAAAGPTATPIGSRFVRALLDSRQRQTAKVAPTCYLPNDEQVQAAPPSPSAAGSNVAASAGPDQAAPEAEPAAASPAATPSALGGEVVAPEVAVSSAALPVQVPSGSRGIAHHAWLRSVAEHFHLYGLLYLLDTRNDSVTGLEEMLQDESLAHMRTTIATHNGSAAAAFISSRLPAVSGSSPPAAAVTGVEAASGPFSVLLRDSFLRQYLILLEATGQLLFTSKLWGYPQLDNLFLSASQNERAAKLRIYRKKPHNKSQRKKDEETADYDSDDEEEEGEDTSDWRTAVSACIPRWARCCPGKRDIAASPTPSAPPIGAPVSSAPPAASKWKLVCLLISLGVTSWLPLVTWVNYTSYMGALDHFLLTALIPYIAVFTYLVGRVLQYPYLCYRQNWMAMMVRTTGKGTAKSAHTHRRPTLRLPQLTPRRRVVSCRLVPCRFLFAGAVPHQAEADAQPRPQSVARPAPLPGALPHAGAVRPGAVVAHGHAAHGRHRAAALHNQCVAERIHGLHCLYEQKQTQTDT